MLYSPQHNEVYKITGFYAKMFIFLFLMVTWLQWAFTMLETEIFKYNFLHFYIAEKHALYWREINSN